jgi:predicted Zn-dependent protease with MMP-like domain
MVRGPAVHHLVRRSADPLSTRILASLGVEYNSFRPGYQRNIEAISRDETEVRRQIRATLLHEVGHYFGLSEEELRGG